MTISATSQGLKPGVCLSTNRPANPFDGQVIYMTDVDQSAVWDGTSWVGLDPSRDRNVVINGAMQVAQRGTSTASITSDNYFTADRFKTGNSGMGTWTQSVESDAPTGSGFRKSLKMLCTTANASPATTNNLAVIQFMEGQNIQQFAKGTASAKQFTLSFWVKSNVTGTYIVELFDNDNTRQTSISYTVSASATWEKKTITFAADTTGAFDNDNAASLQVTFWLGAGPSIQSGTLQTTWASNTTANRAVGQINLAAATSNYWQITGVQLEAGAVATPFEFEDIGTTLAKCQRYYQVLENSSVYTYFCSGEADISTNFEGVLHLPVSMRANISSVTTSGTAANYQVYGSAAGNVCTAVPSGSGNKQTVHISASTTGLTAGRAYLLVSNNTTAAYLAFSSEL